MATLTIRGLIGCTMVHSAWSAGFLAERRPNEGLEQTRSALVAAAAALAAQARS